MNAPEPGAHLSALRVSRINLAVLIVLAAGLAMLLFNFVQRSETSLWEHVVHLCLLALSTLGEHLVYLPQVVLLLLICIGAVSMLVELTLQILRTQRAVRHLGLIAVALPARLRPLARQLGLEPRLDVLATNQPTAFCYGFWKPRVLVTTGLLDTLADDELLATLAHERSHLRARDPLQLLVLRALAKGLFFLPVARDLSSGAELAQEVAADAEVVRVLGGSSALASAMLKLSESQQMRDDSRLAIGRFSHMDARIQYLAEPSKRMAFTFSYARLAWSGLIVILMVVALFPSTPNAPSALSLDPDNTNALEWQRHAGG